MTKYYATKLSGKRLQKVYDLAPPRTLQYLHSEIDEVLLHLHDRDRVLELGCGYGRIMRVLAPQVGLLVGIDNSRENLQFGLEYLESHLNSLLAEMDAASLAIVPNSFDAVLCLQNGIAAFRIEPLLLLSEALRVCRIGGRVIVSTYSPKFWEHRLEWFRLQSDAGLLGEIDEVQTRDGVIVCKDGFRSASVSSSEFQQLAESLEVPCEVFEVDDSSIFCVLEKS